MRFEKSDGRLFLFDSLKSLAQIGRVDVSVNYSKPFFSAKKQLLHYFFIY